jgi:D-alanyl-D-alanine carboxypeptidase
VTVLLNPWIPILALIGLTLYAAGARAENSGALDLQAAISAATQSSKAAVFLDVQGCGLTFSAASGVTDRRRRIKAQIDMPLRLGSIGKLYTAAVIHRLAARGTLDLDDPVSRYLEVQDASGVAARDATLRQLLNHTSGIPDYYDAPDISRWNWREPLTPARILRAIENVPATGAAGAAYAYSNSGYHLVALAAERATGKQFKYLMQSEVLVPAMLRGTQYNMAAPGGALHGYVGRKDFWRSAENSGPDSGVTATLADLRQFLRTLFLGTGPLRAAGQAMAEKLVETGKPRQQAGAGAEVRTSREGLRLIGHTGNVEGYLSFAYVAPDYGLTMIGHMTASDSETFAALLGATANTVQSACGVAGQKAIAG